MNLERTRSSFLVRGQLLQFGGIVIGWDALHHSLGHLIGITSFLASLRKSSFYKGERLLKQFMYEQIIPTGR